jgi:hypothetical protein
MFSNTLQGSEGTITNGRATLNPEFNGFIQNNKAVCFENVMTHCNINIESGTYYICQVMEDRTAHSSG